MGHGLRSTQIANGEIKRQDLNVLEVGAAVIRRLIAGTDISFTSTGADTGTGDVTINSTAAGGIVLTKISYRG